MSDLNKLVNKISELSINDRSSWQEHCSNNAKGRRDCTKQGREAVSKAPKPQLHKQEQGTTHAFRAGTSVEAGTEFISSILLVKVLIKSKKRKKKTCSDTKNTVEKILAW